MKLSDYRVLLDQKQALQRAAESYYAKLSIPFTSITVTDTQNSFVVIRRTCESKEYVQSVSIWSLIEDKQPGGCTGCMKGV